MTRRSWSVVAVFLAWPSALAAGPILAPLDGHITLAELSHLVEAGPLVWTTDGDMVIAQYWDDEPGIGATVKHPVSLLETSETAIGTTAILRTVAGLTCGRYQLDFERYPLDHSTIRSLVIDTGVWCGPHETPEEPIPTPEPATIGLVGVGLLALARKAKR